MAGFRQKFLLEKPRIREENKRLLSFRRLDLKAKRSPRGSCEKTNVSSINACFNNESKQGALRVCHGSFPMQRRKKSLQNKSSRPKFANHSKSLSQTRTIHDRRNGEARKKTKLLINFLKKKTKLTENRSPDSGQSANLHPGQEAHRATETCSQ